MLIDSFGKGSRAVGKDIPRSHKEQLSWNCDSPLCLELERQVKQQRQRTASAVLGRWHKAIGAQEVDTH